MSLQDELAAQLAEFERVAPADRAALFSAKVEELRATFPVERALQPGAIAPGFALPDARGQSVALDAVLREGPAIIVFYRGGWCPYCNLQLRAWQRALPEVAALGARLIAISPQVPDASMSTAEKNALAFTVLSDQGNAVARSFGLVYTLPEELQAALRAHGRDLPATNGDPSWELPLTATYLLGRDGRVVLADIELDYRRRMEPGAVIAVLRDSRAARAAA
jgi:peroxiredoxin